MLVNVLITFGCSGTRRYQIDSRIFRSPTLHLERNPDVGQMRSGNYRRRHANISSQSTARPVSTVLQLNFFSLAWETFDFFYPKSHP